MAVGSLKCGQAITKRTPPSTTTTSWPPGVSQDAILMFFIFCRTSLLILKKSWFGRSDFGTFVDFSLVFIGFREQAKSMTLGGLESGPKHVFGGAQKTFKNLGEIEQLMF